jgi:hypothetical protein
MLIRQIRADVYSGGGLTSVKRYCGGPQRTGGHEQLTNVLFARRGDLSSSRPTA